MTAAAQIATWLAASLQNDRSPKGDLILRGPFGALVTVGLDDEPPAAPAGSLPIPCHRAMCPHGPRQRGNPG